MASRGYCLLVLASLPVNDPGRDYVWDVLVEERGNEEAVQRSLWDYKRRGFVTTVDHRTAELTKGGKFRKVGEGTTLHASDGESRIAQAHKLYTQESA